MIYKPPPFKGLDIRITIIIPIQGRGFIKQGSGLVCSRGPVGVLACQDLRRFKSRPSKTSLILGPIQLEEGVWACWLTNVRIIEGCY